MNLIEIYRQIKPYMVFEDLYDENFTIYEENNQVFIKYTTKSQNIDTEGKIMAGNIKILTLKDLGINNF